MHETLGLYTCIHGGDRDIRDNPNPANKLKLIIWLTKLSGGEGGEDGEGFQTTPKGRGRDRVKSPTTPKKIQSIIWPSREARRGRMGGVANNVEGRKGQDKLESPTQPNKHKIII